jgi:two-component system, LytTR family, response regulator
MSSIKTIIIDDEPGCIETLSLLLKGSDPDVELLGTATSIASGLPLIAKHEGELDLLFIDIQMPGGDGFTLLQKIPNITFKVIFTTAHDSYAIRAIKYSALDYLLKPITQSELIQALEKFRSMTPGYELGRMDMLRLQLTHKGTFEKLAVSTLNDIVMIQLDKIIYLEGYNNYTTFHLDDGQRIVSSKNIGYYEDLLNGNSFFRIHNSYIINLKRMSRYIRGGSGTAEMEGGIKLTVSARRKDNFIKQLSLI